MFKKTFDFSKCIILATFFLPVAINAAALTEQPRADNAIIRLKEIWGNLKDSKNIYYQGDEFIEKNKSKILESFDLSNNDTINAYFDSGRILSCTRGILLTNDKIAWKHLYPTAFSINLNSIKKLTVKHDIGLSLSVWVLIINDSDEAQIRLSELRKKEIPTFLAGLLSYIKFRYHENSIEVQGAADIIKEFPLGLDKMIEMAEGKYQQVINECTSEIAAGSKVCYNNYLNAIAYANLKNYVNAFKSLKLCVISDDFNPEVIDIKSDFRNHPTIIYSVPPNIKDLAFQTNQLFEIENNITSNQKKLNNIVNFSYPPPAGIDEARDSLLQGNFDAAYIEYMRFLSSIKRIDDENVYALLECLYAWYLPYISRVHQISVALNGGSIDDKLDPEIARMVSPHFINAIISMSRNYMPSVVSSYEDRYLSLEKAAYQAESLDYNYSKDRYLVKSFLLAGIIGGVFADRLVEEQHEDYYSLLKQFPPFDIIEWKEATIDYSKLKMKYKESMKYLQDIFNSEKINGTLSSEILTTLLEYQRILENQYLYVEKLYRAFLFDAPMRSNLINLRLRMKTAKHFFNDDENKIQEVGRQYSKLMPVLKYIVLDQTHKDWEDLTKLIKSELNENEFGELKQEAKTLPDWFADIN